MVMVGDMVQYHPSRDETYWGRELAGIVCAVDGARVNLVLFSPTGSMIEPVNMVRFVNPDEYVTVGERFCCYPEEKEQVILDHQVKMVQRKEKVDVE